MEFNREMLKDLSKVFFEFCKDVVDFSTFLL
jgi:hypothetical protein